MGRVGNTWSLLQTKISSVSFSIASSYLPFYHNQNLRLNLLKFLHGGFGWVVAIIVIVIVVACEEAREVNTRLCREYTI